MSRRFPVKIILNNFSWIKHNKQRMLTPFLEIVHLAANFKGPIVRKRTDFMLNGVNNIVDIEQKKQWGQK